VGGDPLRERRTAAATGLTLRNQSRRASLPDGESCNTRLFKEY